MAVSPHAQSKGMKPPRGCSRKQNMRTKNNSRNIRPIFQSAAARAGLVPGGQRDSLFPEGSRASEGCEVELWVWGKHGMGL